MIAYRAEVRCDGGLEGCLRMFARGRPHEDPRAAASSASNLEEIALRDGWVRDGAAHFCPQCQIQRASGPIIDALAIHVVEARR